MDKWIHLCFSTNKAAIATVWKKGEESTAAKALLSSAAAVSKLLLCATPLQTRKKAPKTFRLDKLKMYETSNVLNRSLCRIIIEEKISRAFKMLQNFFDDWRKIEDNIFM